MDYLDKKIDISGPLLPDESNCPTRVGEIVETVSDIYNIPSPRVGMIVYVESNKKNYIIKSLKSEIINGVSVDNARVDTYEELDKEVFDAISKAEAAIKLRAVDADSLNVELEIDGVRIDFATLDDGAHSGNITIPAATTESAGVMSAEDKKILNTIAGANSEIAFTDAEIGTANTFFDFSQPFPVQVGQTYTFSVNLNNSIRCDCYLWDGDTYLGYVSLAVGTKSFSFTPEKDGVVRKLSLRGSVAFNVAGSISIVLTQREVATVEELAEVNNKAENIIRKLTVKYNILEGYYAGDTGKFHQSETYVCTSLIPCVSGKTYNTPQAFRFTFYDENKSFISAISPNIGEIPNNAKYVGITYTATKWNKDEFYFYTDDLNDAIVYKNELYDAINSAKEEAIEIYKSEFKNNLLNEPTDELQVVSGNYGEKGAIYRIPLRSSGKYVVGIDFKFPENLNSGTDVLDIFGWDNIPKYTRFYGKFKSQINCALATTEYQQVVCNAKLMTYTNTATSASVPVPSYRCEYVPNTNDNGMPFGETAFSIRYTGTSTTQSVSLNETGLVVYDNDVEIASVIYPSNKSLVDFANNIATACSNGTLVDFVCEIYDVFTKTTDDLVRVENIPVRYNYSYGEDSFPMFFKTIDKAWHRLEVVLDNTDVNKKHITVLVDGNPQKLTPTTFSFSDGYNGVFDEYFTIGGGVEVRNFNYKNNSTKISSPRIVVEMLHNIKDDVSSGAGGGESAGAGNLISVQEIEGIITTYHNNGYKHISLEEVSNYLNGNIELQGKFFCMIHDDDNFAANFKKLEQMYKRHAVKATFALIDKYMSAAEENHFKRNKNLFCYTLHHELGWASIPYSQLCEIMETDLISLETKLEWATNLAIYPGGGNNLAVQNVLSSYGIGYCGIVGTSNLLKTTSRANNKMAAPRMLRSLGKYDNLQTELDSVAKYYD